MVRSPAASPFRFASVLLTTVAHSGDSAVYEATKAKLPKRFFLNQFEAFEYQGSSQTPLAVKRCRRSKAEVAFSGRMFWKSCCRRGVSTVAKKVAVLSSMLWLQV